MVCTSVEGNGSIVISTAFFVYITYYCTNFAQIVLTVTNATSEATGYHLSHSLEIRGGAQTFVSDVQLASFDTSYRSQTNLHTCSIVDISCSGARSSQNLAPSSFVCNVIAEDLAALPTFDGCRSWLDVLEPQWPGFGGATTMLCQSLPPRPHNTSTLSPIQSKHLG